MRKLSPPAQSLSLTEYLPVLENLFAGFGVVAVYLYGSHGTPQQTPLSDIDLAVITEPDSDLALLELIGEVGAVMGEDVSVTWLNEAPLPLRFKVLKTGRPLFVFAETGLADFTEQTLNFYHDFLPDYEATLRDYDEGLQERYGG